MFPEVVGLAFWLKTVHRTWEYTPEIDGIFRQNKLLLAFLVKSDLAVFFFSKVEYAEFEKMFTKLKYESYGQYLPKQNGRHLNR